MKKKPMPGIHPKIAKMIGHNSSRVALLEFSFMVENLSEEEIASISAIQDETGVSFKDIYKVYEKVKDFDKVKSAIAQESKKPQ